MHHTQTAGRNQHTADDGHLGDEFLRDKGLRHLGNAVDGREPDEHDNGGDGNGKAITGSDDNHRHKVHRGKGHEKRVVAVEGRIDGTHDGQCAHATEEYGCGNSLRNIRALAHDGGGLLHALVEAQKGAEQSTEGETEDEEDGIFTLRHIVHCHIDAQHEGSQSHGRIEHVDVLLADALARQSTDGTSQDDGDGIDKDC